MSGGPLAGSVVAVPGAGGSLGPHVVRALAEAGAQVAATDVSQERLPGPAAAPTRARDPLGTARPVALLDPADPAAWASDVEQRFGRVDAVVHLVGGWRGGTPLPSAPLEDWELLSTLLVRTCEDTACAL